MKKLKEEEEEDNLIYLLSRVNIPDSEQLLINTSNIKDRLHYVFEAIFTCWCCDDTSYVEKNKEIYPKFGSIILNFCNLIMKCNGLFHVTDDSVYLFEDTRFFFPMYFMTDLELTIIATLLENGILPMNTQFLVVRNTKYFQTLRIPYKPSWRTRTNFLLGYLRHLYYKISGCYYGMKMKKTEKMQFQIKLCQNMIELYEHISCAYGIDLSELISKYKDLIKKNQPC